jgi:hypothetical protein
LARSKGRGELGKGVLFSPVPLFTYSPLPLFPYFGKYFSIVAGLGLVVANENPIIKSAEIMTIGTTGIKPNTAVPPGVRVST